MNSKSISELTIDELRSLIRDVVRQETRSRKKSVMLTTSEVIDQYGVSRQTLQRYHKEGLSYISSNPNKYLKSDLDKFFESKKQ